MDGQRFDHLVRVLASGPSRRRLLQNLAIGTLALLGYGDEGDDAKAAGCYKKKKRCRDHHQCCSGRCRHGWCKGGKRNEPCQPGQALCDDRCVDVQTDPQNCGGCGQTCAAGSRCCGGACLDIQTDPLSCGACGQSCAAGTRCCGGACRDVQTDPQNCGECGQTCAAGSLCCGGACADLQTDSENCGACGVPCENGAVCVAGSCLCPEGTRECNGRCIALDACCGVCIVLTWGATPTDLDSHGWTPDGTEVYYNALGTVEAFPWMALDVDDITSFGPEQISISQLLPGQTSYAVQNFRACQGTEASSLAGSGATVRVTRDGVNLGEFTAPESGEGVWWNVVQFDEDGNMTVIDEISDTPPRPSAVSCVTDTSLARGEAISKEASVPEKRNARKRRDRRKQRNR